MSEKRFVVPDTVSTNFHIRAGDKVADFGAGAGYFLQTLSRLVGSDGRVYAIEIQKNLIESLSDKLRRDRLGNVEIVWGDIEEVGGTKLKNESLDVVIMVNTLFQTEDRSEAVREAMRTLRDGGKLFVIDWSESWGGLGPQPGHVLKESEARAICETLGLTYQRNFDAGDHHYGLGFGK